MTKPKVKRYHAVLHGHFAPAIFTSWAITHAVTDNYPRKQHKGFGTLTAAQEYLERNGCNSYRVWTDNDPTSNNRSPTEAHFYAVINGRTTGVYSTYLHGAEEEIRKQPHSCHKRFNSHEEAKREIERYQRIADFLDTKSDGGGLEEIIDSLYSLNLVD